MCSRKFNILFYRTYRGCYARHRCGKSGTLKTRKSLTRWHNKKTERGENIRDRDLCRSRAPGNDDVHEPNCVASACHTPDCICETCIKFLARAHPAAPLPPLPRSRNLSSGPQRATLEGRLRSARQDLQKTAQSIQTVNMDIRG